MTCNLLISKLLLHIFRVPVLTKNHIFAYPAFWSGLKIINSRLFPDCFPFFYRFMYFLCNNKILKS